MPFIPNDPLYNQQWHFDFLGDIETIWDDYSGLGVNVGIYDDGVQSSHFDLNDNYNSSLHVSVGGSTLTGEDGFPFIEHGTSVAGLIGAEANGVDTVGVSFGATMTGVPIFSGAADINNNFSGFLTAVDQSENFDVINHSWGIGSGGFFLPTRFFAQNQVVNEWLEAAEFGRNGLGTIQVKSAGNDNANGNGEWRDGSRVTITVGAYDDDGDVSSYSTFGSHLLVSSPSDGDLFDGNREQVTVDMLGSDGYTPENFTNVNNGFGGTSGAAPLVTGVVALMLEANSSLGWRDVQNILAYSSTSVGSGVGGVQLADEDHNWFYNGADNWNGGGLHFSEDYGYGALNAYNAVRLAESWDNFRPSQTSSNEFSETVTAGSVALPDLSTTDVNFTFVSDLDLEYVEVTLDITHSFLPDLRIELISAEGTSVDLFNGDGEEDLADFGWTWTFGANAFRGEDLTGNWTIRITDEVGVDFGTLNSAAVTAYGGNHSNSDIHVFTDEYALVSGDGNHDTAIVSDGGIDIVNAAAIASDLVIDLTGTVNGSIIAGVATTLTGFTDAHGGDGNDVFYVNGSNNFIYGGRGIDKVDYVRSTLDGVNEDLVSPNGVLVDVESLGGTNGEDELRGDDIDNFLRGYDDEDLLIGRAGNDILFGNDGNDIMRGDAGDDRLVGHFGDDVMFGGSGADEFYGGAGRDTVSYYTSDAGITVDLEDNSDNTGDAVGDAYDRIERIVGSQFEDRLLGDATSNRVVGREGNDVVAGREGNDRVFGQEGQDRVYGGDGNDLLDGGDSSDLLIGGSGRDAMIGGGGSDTFRYNESNDSLTSAFDTIRDFQVGVDLVDLSRIDARTDVGGNNAFEFIGQQSFSGDSGELQAVGKFVRGDLDGDGAADFTIRVFGASDMEATDFIL